MALGDIYQVKLFSTLNGESMVNVFYYREATNDIDANAEELADGFVTDVLTPLLNLVCTDVSYVQVQVVNGMDNADQHVIDLSTPGNRAIGVAPANIAVGFRKRTGGVGFRYSYKRFGGVPISAVGLNGWNNVAGTYISDLAAMATALGSTLTEAEGAYEPVQITGGFSLLTPPTFKQLLTGDWQVNDRASHQDTRQQFEWYVP